MVEGAFVIQLSKISSLFSCTEICKVDKAHRRFGASASPSMGHPIYFCVRSVTNLITNVTSSSRISALATGYLFPSSSLLSAYFLQYNRHEYPRLAKLDLSQFHVEL